MTPPIIIDARGDLLFFKTAERAEGYVEEVDVENDEYRAVFDSEGHRYKLTVRPSELRLAGPVSVNVRRVVIEPDDHPDAQEELRRLLVDYLGRATDETPTLAELIERAVARGGLR
jgi:hypothetical protein